MKHSMSSTLMVLGLSVLGIGAASAAPATVAADINLRRGPGTNFGVVTVIPEGETVNRGSCSSNNWCRVSWNGVSGYLKASYLVAGGGSGRVVRSRRVYEEPETVYVEPEVETYPYDYGYGAGVAAPIFGGSGYWRNGRQYYGNRYDNRYYGNRNDGNRYYGNRNDGNRYYGNRNNNRYYGNAPATFNRQQNNAGGGVILGQPARPEAGQGLSYGPGGQVSGSGSGAPGVEPNLTDGAR